MISRLIDRACHPAVAYPNLGYIQQAMRFFMTAFKGKQASKNIVYGIWLILMIAITICLTPLAIVFYLVGLRFISIDLSQVGSIVYLDLILRDAILNGKSNPHNFFVARSTYTDANSVAIDLYLNKVTFISSPLMKLLTTPFFMNRIFQENSFRFDTANTFEDFSTEQKVFAHQVQKKFRDEFGAPLVSMSDGPHQEARKLMQETILKGKKFIAVHVRDSGFYKDNKKTSRNGDISNYEEVFKYLIAQGYMVVRMGDPGMVPIDSMVKRCGPNLFDYAHSNLCSPILDCLLISDCDFYIGLASGIWSLAIVFEKPTILVNFYSAATGLGYGASDLTTFKTLRYCSDKSLVPFEKLFMPPFCFNPPTRVLESSGVYLEDTTSEDILDTIKEFLSRQDFGESEVQAISRGFIKKQNFAWGGAGSYSHVILKKYFPQYFEN